MDANTAQQRIESMTDASTDPSLSTTEVDALLTIAQRVDPAGNPATNLATAPTWAADTAYAYGDVVTADPTADRWWQCVSPGTSGATQPTWPDQSGQAPGVTTVSDGDAVTWLDVGTLWTPTYDLNAAAAEGWRIKGGKAAARFDFTSDGQMFRRSQIIAGCRHMERVYRRRVAAGVM